MTNYKGSPLRAQSSRPAETLTYLSAGEFLEMQMTHLLFTRGIYVYTYARATKAAH